MLNICSKGTTRALDSITTIRHIRDAQRSKPLPLRKLRFICNFVGVWSYLRPLIAAGLCQLIHDGKVRNIHIYDAFTAENGSFEEDMELGFGDIQAQDCDTGALQKAWNEQVKALSNQAEEERARWEDRNHSWGAWHR